MGTMSLASFKYTQRFKFKVKKDQWSCDMHRTADAYRRMMVHDKVSVSRSGIITKKVFLVEQTFLAYS